MPGQNLSFIEKMQGKEKQKRIQNAYPEWRETDKAAPLRQEKDGRPVTYNSIYRRIQALQKKNISKDDELAIATWLNAHKRDTRIPPSSSKDDFHKNRIWYNHVMSGLRLEESVKAKLPETRG